MRTLGSKYAASSNTTHPGLLLNVPVPLRVCKIGREREIERGKKAPIMN